jgi:DNA processing protein
MNQELFYQLALNQVPHIGNIQAKILLQEFGSASALFKATQQELEKMEGIGPVRAKSIKAFSDFPKVETEIRFIEKYKIKPLFFTDQGYPHRLLRCKDAPILLFYKGQADLNAPKIVGIVGTRNNTVYGKTVTAELVKGLASPGVVVISGLATGIDTIAHQAALENDIPTVGVVGHGLDRIYPSVNRSLAIEMINKKGGLLSEFFSGTPPDKHHFPMRNRIVGGLCDATVIVEADINGGSLITAKKALAYGRHVFAVPGRTSDSKSAGCNFLIKQNKAALLNNADDLITAMGWRESENIRER